MRCRRALSEVKQIAAEGHIEPAMLMAWATFEALARALLTKQFGRPQTPGRLVQTLAAEGYLTPSEADQCGQWPTSETGSFTVNSRCASLQGSCTISPRSLETLLQQVPR